MCVCGGGLDKQLPTRYDRIFVKFTKHFSISLLTDSFCGMELNLIVLCVGNDGVKTESGPDSGLRLSHYSQDLAFFALWRTASRVLC